MGRVPLWQFKFVDFAPPGKKSRSADGMKFANRLEEEKIPAWAQEYMEYKLLKKRLKRPDEPGSSAAFFRLLDEQFVKVVSFMRVQQEMICRELEADLLPLALQAAPARGAADGPQTLARCQSLEEQVGQFLHYVRLNQDGLRKILKKFDKRFRTSVREAYPRVPTRLPFSVGEVQAWMLDPTMQVVELVRQGDLSTDGPLRQLNFWVEELKVGCQLASAPRFASDLPLTPLRSKLCRPPAASRGALQGGSGTPSSSGSTRWWTEVTDACALTGFPVRMLPYPPFKLRAGGPEASGGRLVLVDGQFLMLQVLSTWRFEALGRALDEQDIGYLDRHIQQCKLGPFRLGKALQLFAEGSEKHAEVKALRAKARQKLDALRHIQRSRMQQGA